MDQDFDIELFDDKKDAAAQVQLPVNFLALGEIEPDDVKVYIKQDVYRALERFAVSDTSKELGSILLGGYAVEHGKTHVVISRFIEAKYTDASASVSCYCAHCCTLVTEDLPRYAVDSVGHTHFTVEDHAVVCTNECLIEVVSVACCENLSENTAYLLGLALAQVQKLVNIVRTVIEQCAAAVLYVCLPVCTHEEAAAAALDHVNLTQQTGVHNSLNCQIIGHRSVRLIDHKLSAGFLHNIIDFESFCMCLGHGLLKEYINAMLHRIYGVILMQICGGCDNYYVDAGFVNHLIVICVSCCTVFSAYFVQLFFIDIADRCQFIVFMFNNTRNMEAQTHTKAYNRCL